MGLGFLHRKQRLNAGFNFYFAENKIDIMRQVLLLAVFLTIGISLSAQEKYTITGYLTDHENGERLIGATVFCKKNGKGTVTNEYGFYSLTLPKGNYLLQTSYIGYQPAISQVQLFSDTILNIGMISRLEIEEVKVVGKERISGVNDLSGLSYSSIDLEQLRKAPIVLGEQDLLKGLQFLPGVKQGRENTASFNVRGGSNDQNLILLDGVPVYNVNHLFGFFSVFNADAINHVGFYKAGIPARYGGRLSSVLDVSMKDGNLKKQGGIFSISPISGKLTYETPIVKDKASLIVSGRRTWLDVPLRLLLKLEDSAQEYGYFFYDVNAKLNWKINDRNRIFLSTYSGKDEQFYRSTDEEMNTHFNYEWGNLTTVLRWNTVLSSKVFANISAYYSQYKLEEETVTTTKQSRNVFLARSKMKDLTFKADVDYYLSPEYKIRIGGSFSNQYFYPGFANIKSVEGDVILNDEDENTMRVAVAYVENQFNLGALGVNAGIRFSGNRTGETTYLSCEPRLAINYRVSTNLDLFASYGRFSQNLHLLSNSSLGLPTDLWVASTDNTGPQKGDQYALGLKKTINNRYRFSSEVYYKTLNDLIRFDEGAIFLSSKRMNWEENISIGKGKAYGIELQLEKQTGEFTGMVAYTLAWSKRQFDAINNGRWFDYKYDRRHDLSILGEYPLKSKRSTRSRSLNFGFTFQSGNKLSLPEVEHEGVVPFEMDKHNLDEFRERFNTVISYAQPNQFKMPAFHHLDISYNLNVKKGVTRGYEWNFSVYNIYNRMNPWFYRKQSGKVKQVSAFPLVPSVGFTYRW